MKQVNVKVIADHLLNLAEVEQKCLYAGGKEIKLKVLCQLENFEL